MGEENRGSSGASTALLVVGIVVVVLMIPCCGVVGLFGFGFFVTARSVQQDVIRTDEARRNFERAQEEINRSNAEMQEATDKLRNELDSIKLPDNLGPATEPPRIPDPTTPGAPGSPETTPGSDVK